MTFANSIPGEGTTISYAGMPELRDELPAKTGEQARQIARSVLSRLAEQVAYVESAVAKLAPGYPSSFNSTVAWLRGQNLRALDVASGEPHAALASIRRIAADVDQTARALVESTRAISGRFQVMPNMPLGRPSR